MPTPHEYRPALERTLAEALRYLGDLPQERVAAPLSGAELASRFRSPLPAEGTPAPEVLGTLVRDAGPGIMRTSGGRSFAWVIGGTLPGALAADWMTSVWDQNAALSACSPAAAAVEAVVGEWLKELLRLPRDASFAVVTGCQMAHFTCLASARHQLLAQRGWDVEREGLCGAPRLRVIDVGARHASVDRALRFLGMGTACVTSLRGDSASLEAVLAEDPETPTVVLLQAGDIHTGKSDAFERLIPLAHRYGAWVHVDGAFGLWAQASAAQRHHMAGVEAADSWATDGHKWLNVPFDAGYAIVAHPRAHRAAMTTSASYIDSAERTSEALREPLDWTPEWSRRARAFSTYAAIRELGQEGVEEQIDRACRWAAALVEGMGLLPRVEIVSPAVLNQGMIRVRAPNADATPSDHDAATLELVARLATQGETFVQPSQWKGQTVIRVSVCSWQTTAEDVRRTLNAVEHALAE
ncbi:MAG: aminotransferase class V-fold PLP-dependent enzyme [Myxococcota bacterium]